jgi:tRNA-dihydrouridine synthase
VRLSSAYYSLDLIKSMSYKPAYSVLFEAARNTMPGQDDIAKNSKGLAPMEGVTDFPTRYWFRMIGGMDFLWTPFLRVTDSFPKTFPEAFAPELFKLKGRFKTPLVIQIMGSRPDDVVRTAECLGERIDFIDLNCGCPSPTVVGSRAGSSLLEHVDLFSSFIESVVQRVGPRRLSVKVRTGFHHESELDGILDSIQNVPLRHITVHGRTRPQRYKGASNWSRIETASRICKIPVIGSGDICDDSGFSRRLHDQSRVHAVIVGRGALRNPWVFSGKREAPVSLAWLFFVVLQDVYLESSDLLVRWVADSSLERLSTSDDFWQATASLLNYCGRSVARPEDVACSPRALARGKMIWGYLRSSLPLPFMDPMIMRAKTVSELLQAVDEISRQLDLEPDNLPLRYDAERDWIYSGEGRGT